MTTILIRLWSDIRERQVRIQMSSIVLLTRHVLLQHLGLVQ